MEGVGSQRGQGGNNNDADHDVQSVTSGVAGPGTVASAAESVSTAPAVDIYTTTDGEQSKQQNQQQQQEKEQQPQRIDPITALLVDIDNLSLSMFEALRGLRDAVAPESGNLGGGGGVSNDESNPNDSNNGGGGTTNPSTTTSNTSTISQQNQPSLNPNALDSYEDFIQLYKAGDPKVVSMVERAMGANEPPPTTNSQFIRIHTRLALEADAILVQRLAQNVLDKSQIIDDHVSSLPGINRTKEEQLLHIQELLKKSRDVDTRLVTAYHNASQQRDAIRRHIMDNTSLSLGIEEE